VTSEGRLPFKPSFGTRATDVTATHHSFDRWLQRYGDAWTEGDPAAAAQLFSPEAAYFETPFDPPMIGTAAILRYWAEGAKSAQTQVTFGGTVVSFDGTTGFAQWHARFRRVPSHVLVELDGVLRATFDDKMRCVEFREWWHRRES